MQRYRESVERRLGVLKYASGGPEISRRVLTGGRRVASKVGRLDWDIDSLAESASSPEALESSRRSGRIFALWPIIKGIGLRNTEFIMDEMLVINTFERLVASKATLVDIEKQAVALAGSIRPPLGGTPEEVETAMIAYIKSGGKMGHGQNPAGQRPDSDPSGVKPSGGDDLMSVGVRSEEMVNWLIGFAKDTSSDTSKIGTYSSFPSQETRAEKIIWLASSLLNTRAPLPPPPIEEFGKAKRYVSKRYRTIPTRYDPLPLRKRWEALAEKAKNGGQKEALEAEKKVLEAEMGKLEMMAIEYWRSLWQCYSRCRAEELAYENERSLIDEGRQREVVVYLSDKKAYLEMLRGDITNSIIVAGAAAADISQGDMRAVVACTNAINSFMAKAAPRMARNCGDVAKAVLDFLRLPRGGKATLEFFSSPVFEMGGVAARGAELVKRGEQLRFFLSWLVLVD